MMSAQRRLLVLVGVLIAVAAASTSALLIMLSRPAVVATPTTQVMTLAASTGGNTITVVGIGFGTGVPNQAQLMLGVNATRPRVADAVTVAGADMTRLLAALHKQGVVDKDIQTASIWVQQQSNCCPQTVTGYSASAGLTVTVHHVNNVTSLTVAAVDAVGDDLQINGVSFSVADQGPMLKAARAAAMSDASLKAQDYARLSGHHVGGLVGVSEVVSTTGGFACDQCGGKGGAGGIPVAAGQATVTVTVAVTYELAT